MLKNIFGSRNAIHVFSAIVLTLVLGLFYYLLVPDLSPFYHGDHSVPYQMTITSWHLNDFFYWGANRFGANYMVFWKAVGKSIFGKSPEAFFYGHGVIVLCGYFLWLLLLRSPLSKVLFVLLLMPTTFLQIDETFFPGQPYGMLIFLNGIAFNLLFRFKSWNRIALTGLFVAFMLLLWMHLLAAGMFLCLALIRLHDYWKDNPQDHAAQRRDLKSFGAIFGLVIIAFEIFRRQVFDLGGPGALSISRPYELLKSVIDFSQKGFSYHYGPTYGITMLLLAVVTVWLLRRSEHRDSRWNLRLMMYSALVPLCFAGYILAHRHYQNNLRSERYFLFLLPILLFVILTVFQMVSGRVKVVFFASFVLMLIGPRLLRSKDAELNVFNRTAYSSDRARGAMLAAKYAQLRDIGCKNLIGGYWEVYPSTTFTQGEMLAAATDVPRNEWMLRQMLANLNGDCIHTTAIAALKIEPGRLEHCRPIPHGFVFCR